MLSTLDDIVASYKCNKNNTNPKFVERNGLQAIVCDLKEEILKILPHGSGIDCTWRIEQEEDLNFNCYNSYHAMDQNGYYCGYVDFTVIFNADTKDFDVIVSKDDIDAIEEDYRLGAEQDSKRCEIDFLDSDNPCPYLDDLGDSIYVDISSSLDDYMVRQSIRYAMKYRPDIIAQELAGKSVSFGKRD